MTRHFGSSDDKIFWSDKPAQKKLINNKIMSIKTGQLKRVDNTERKFGSSADYFAGYLEIDGKIEPVLLTQSDIHAIINRAEDNPEDMPKRRKTFLEWLFN